MPGAFGRRGMIMSESEGIRHSEIGEHSPSNRTRWDLGKTRSGLVSGHMGCKELLEWDRGVRNA